jgi:hypothetical protein
MPGGVQLLIRLLPDQTVEIVTYSRFFSAISVEEWLKILVKVYGWIHTTVNAKLHSGSGGRKIDVQRILQITYGAVALI